MATRAMTKASATANSSRWKVIRLVSSAATKNHSGTRIILPTCSSSSIPLCSSFYCSISHHPTHAKQHRCTKQQQYYRYLSSSPSSSYKIAIVGSGPSGCYTAKYLQSSFTKKNHNVHIDVIEKLPTPYGLVRYGVAPDHPEVKNVQHDFDMLFEKTIAEVTTHHEHNIQFYGHVHVGRDVSVHELRKLYDIVVLSYGCESDRKLGIAGEELHGVLSAREFVAWYNGHPDYIHIGEKVERALKTIDDDNPNNHNNVRNVPVVVIGQGNVALDCARILAKGATGLYDTDIASHVLPILRNGISNISVIGRRGHVQGAFTIKELRELVKLEQEGYQTSFIVRTDELDYGSTDATKEELNAPNGRPKTRIETLLRDAAAKVPNNTLPKMISLRFLLNPHKFVPSDSNNLEIGYAVCERTCLEGPPGNQIAVGTGIYESLPAKLVLVSIGYKAHCMPGTEQWFDYDRGIVRNFHGRIDPANPDQQLGGLYVAGWLKRGPSGIIGTNIGDAKETVATILKDMEDQNIAREGKARSYDEYTSRSLRSLLIERNIKFVGWDGYRKIEGREKEIRRSEKQPREKLTRIGEMLQEANV